MHAQERNTTTKADMYVLPEQEKVNDLGRKEETDCESDDVARLRYGGRGTRRARATWGSTRSSWALRHWI